MRTRPRLIGNLLIAAGLLFLLVAGFAYFADPSRADQSLPRPVALATATDEPAPAAAPPAPSLPPAPSTTSSIPSIPAPSPEPPLRVVIESIYVDSKVQEIGTAWQNGQLVWETVPFVIGHYRTSAMPGQNGNAIFSGHVTSQTLGNVFINLWQIEIGDDVEVYTRDTVFTYAVSGVRLVTPTDTSVMNPTAGATITLITCAGDWIPSEHQYSQRLIVTGQLKSARPL